MKFIKIFKKRDNLRILVIETVFKEDSIYILWKIIKFYFLSNIAGNLSMYSQKEFDQFNISYIPVNNKLLAFDNCTPDAQVNP